MIPVKKINRRVWKASTALTATASKKKKRFNKFNLPSTVFTYFIKQVFKDHTTTTSIFIEADFPKEKLNKRFNKRFFLDVYVLVKYLTIYT